MALVSPLYHLFFYESLTRQQKGEVGVALGALGAVFVGGLIFWASAVSEFCFRSVLFTVY
jgi:hypothetical protein